MNLKPQESLFENKKVRIIDQDTIWVDGKQFISAEKYERLKAIKIEQLEGLDEMDPYEIGYIIGKIQGELMEIANLLHKK